MGPSSASSQLMPPSVLTCTLLMAPRPDQARPSSEQAPGLRYRMRDMKSGMPGGTISDRGRMRVTGVPGIVIRAGHVVRGLLLISAKWAVDERDGMQPLDVRHAVPAGDDEAQRKPVLGGQRPAVHLVGQEGLVTTRLGEGQAALVMLLDAPLHATIEAGEDDLDGAGERTGGFRAILAGASRSTPRCRPPPGARVG